MDANGYVIASTGIIAGNHKGVKRGRKRLFDQAVYHRRFCAERTFAWVDKFKRLLIRFERYDACFLGSHYIPFSMINLRHILNEKSK